MKIVVDAMPLLVRSAGVKSYLYYWIHAMRAQAGKEAVGVFPPIRTIAPLHHEESLATYWETRLGHLLLHGNTYLPVTELLRGGAQIFHATNLLRRAPRGLLLSSTIHDMTSWVTPEFHTRANVAADHAFAERILKQADGLIAVSEHSRMDAINVLGIPPERIKAIHSGVAPHYFDVDSRWAAAARKVHKLEKPYVLCVGTLEPRKNIGRLLDAWLALPQSLTHDLELVLVGPQGWNMERVVERFPSVPGLRWLGYIDECDLPGLTRGAEFLVYPSLYEGFGFPIAQAMAAGTAVLTSNLSSMPEVAGDGAVLVDPLKVEEIAGGMQWLIESPDLRQTLAKAGRARAERYRWERCAAESLEFFARLLGR